MVGPNDLNPAGVEAATDALTKGWQSQAWVIGPPTGLDQRIADLTPGQSLTKIKADPDRSEVLAALDAAKEKATVPVTKVPAGKSVLADQKRAAKLDKQATAAVKARDEEPKAPAAKKPAAKKAPAKTEGTAPHIALFAELGIDPRQARATLRRKGFSAPYTNLTDIRKALTTDARKAK